MEGSWVFLSERLLRAGSTVIEFKQQVRLTILQVRQSEKKMDNKAITKVWEKEMSQLDFLWQQYLLFKTEPLTQNMDTS